MTKPQSIRMVVINPETKTVSEVFIENNKTLQTWYSTIGNNCILVATAVTISDVVRNTDNSLLMDDEILLRFDDIKGAWKLPNGQVFFNTGIFVGCDEEGENCDTTISTDRLQEHITWLDREQALVEAERIMLEPITVISF